MTSQLIGISYATLKAKADAKVKKEKPVTPQPTQPISEEPISVQQITDTKPSGILELCFPCMNDEGKIQEESEDGETLEEGPMVAQRWLQNMKGVNENEKFEF